MSDEKINDGGLAVDGITMRDWFAGMALQGVLYMVIHKMHDLHPNGPSGLAKECYEIADAMIKARGEK